MIAVVMSKILSSTPLFDNYDVNNITFVKTEYRHAPSGTGGERAVPETNRFAQAGDGKIGSDRENMIVGATANADNAGIHRAS